MDYAKEYAQKLVTADEAVKTVKSGDWVDYGWCNATVDALDKALAKRTDELTDVKLRGGVLFDLVFPLGRNDGQVFAPPVGVFGLVVPWPCEFEHVPEAPGNNIVAATDAAFGFFLIAKTGGNGPAKGGFFGNKQSHVISSCGVWPRFFVQ